jgi:hypothetical protein
MSNAESAGITRIREWKCPVCGAEADAVSEAGGSSLPREGDPVVCAKCGAVAAYDAARGALRPFTEREAAELQTDERLMNDISRAVGRVRLHRSQRN